MKISLPDVNVWIAIAAEGHVDHPIAREWFLSQPAEAVAFCRISQMGFLRLLTNPKVMGQGTRTLEQAWTVYDDLASDRRVFFADEPAGLAHGWRSLTKSGGVNTWTDAYLAAFAGQYRYTFVTFDRGFRRWPELECICLMT
jgi:toxin-antitoxin system PIN domain toxin